MLREAVCIALPHAKGQSAARTLFNNASEKENDLRPESGIIAELSSAIPHSFAESQNLMPELLIAKIITFCAAPCTQDLTSLVQIEGLAGVPSLVGRDLAVLGSFHVQEAQASLSSGAIPLLACGCCHPSPQMEVLSRANGRCVVADVWPPAETPLWMCVSVLYFASH